MSNEQFPNANQNQGAFSPQQVPNPATPQGWENTGIPTQPGQPQGWENSSWQQPGQYPQMGQPGYGYPQMQGPKEPNPVGEFFEGALDASLSKTLKPGFGKLYYLLTLIGSGLLWLLSVIYLFKIATAYGGTDVLYLLMAIFVLILGWIWVIANGAKARITIDLHREAVQAEKKQDNGAPAEPAGNGTL